MGILKGISEFEDKMNGLLDPSARKGAFNPEISFVSYIKCLKWNKVKHHLRHSGESRNPAFVANSEVLDSGSSPE